MYTVYTISIRKIEAWAVPTKYLVILQLLSKYDVFTNGSWVLRFNTWY